MRRLEFKPLLETLEDRSTPAVLGGAYASAANAVFMTQALQTVMDDFEWMSHPSAQPFVRGFFTGLYESSKDVSGPMAGFAQMNAKLASNVGDWLGFSVVPPPIVVPPPPPVEEGPDDSGMTNTLPDVNSTSWVNQLNGLKTWDVVVGTGDSVVASDTVDVYYTGWLLNGTSFDSKRSPADPAKFKISELIQGWQQGIPGMKPGGIRRLYVPAALGYGSQTRDGIPPNSDLVFEMKLISST